MGTIDVTDGDDVHHRKRATVLLEENITCGEEQPDGFLDVVEGLFGSDFEADNQPLIVDFGNNGTKGLVEVRFRFCYRRWCRREYQGFVL
jgi:hypothetical protein